MSSLPPPVRELLAGPLDTFEKLEVALALHRAPGHALSLAELVRALPLPRAEIERGIQELAAARLASSAGGLVRLVIGRTDGAAFDALAAVYESDRTVVAQAMLEVAMDKIRGMAARTFAEAFQSARKKDEDDS